MATAPLAADPDQPAETGGCSVGTPKRGDVVVFRWPATTRGLGQTGRWLPGDRIQMRQGQLFINDRLPR